MITSYHSIFELSGQHTWKMPGNWTMLGYGHPHYKKVMIPFPNSPPDVSDENPTGICRRTFFYPNHGMVDVGCRFEASDY